MLAAEVLLGVGAAPVAVPVEDPVEDVALPGVQRKIGVNWVMPAAAWATWEATQTGEAPAVQSEAAPVAVKAVVAQEQMQALRAGSWVAAAKPVTLTVPVAKLLIMELVWAGVKVVQPGALGKEPKTQVVQALTSKDWALTVATATAERRRALICILSGWIEMDGMGWKEWMEWMDRKEKGKKKKAASVFKQKTVPSVFGEALFMLKGQARLLRRRLGGWLVGWLAWMDGWMKLDGYYLE